MINPSFAAFLLVSAAVAPAVAQPTTAPAPATGQFIGAVQPNQWRVSRLVGVDIYGYDNNAPNDRDKIGDVDEVLLDASGKVEAVVIGVGGFLGIGEKAVAVPFSAVEWRMSGRPQGRPDGLAARTDATPEPAGAQAAPAGRPGDAPATGGAAAGMDRAAMNQGHSDRGYIRMSKADLQNAPTFRYSGEAGQDGTRTGNPGSGAPAGTGRP